MLLCASRLELSHPLGGGWQLRFKIATRPRARVSRAAARMIPASPLAPWRRSAGQQTACGRRVARVAVTGCIKPRAQSAGGPNFPRSHVCHPSSPSRANWVPYNPRGPWATYKAGNA
jgi:hypothetical protein